MREKVNLDTSLPHHALTFLAPVQAKILCTKEFKYLSSNNYVCLTKRGRNNLNSRVNISVLLKV